MKYIDSSVPPGREFLFRGADGHVRGTADSLQSFRRLVATAPDDVLAHHAERGDFSRWVRDVFADAELADLRRAIGGLITVRYGGED